MVGVVTSRAEAFELMVEIPIILHGDSATSVPPRKTYVVSAPDALSIVRTLPERKP